MTKTDGEQELVLGNKQLLSAFFIVVVLLGVFFTMGYIIGRHATAVSPKSDANPAPVSSNAQPDLPARTASVRPVPAIENPAKDPDPVAASPSVPATQPAKPYGDQTEVVAPPRHEEGASAAPPPAGVPAQGSSYLQVAALKRPEAEMEVKILRERKYPALLGESSKEGLYRVLVGPFKDMQSLARTKADLKSAGFDSIVQK